MAKIFQETFGSIKNLTIEIPRPIQMAVELHISNKVITFLH